MKRMQCGALCLGVIQSITPSWGVPALPPEVSISPGSRTIFLVCLAVCALKYNSRMNACAKASNEALARLIRRTNDKLDELIRKHTVSLPPGQSVQCGIDWGVCPQKESKMGESKTCY